MTMLTITSKGQITLRKELLRHLGAKAGDRIEVAVDSDHRLVLQRLQRTGTIDDLFGMLAQPDKRAASIEEMNEAIRDGWAGVGR